jgi:tRNA nucleotidyltransferase (CCA-adding enzyme)
MFDSQKDLAKFVEGLGGTLFLVGGAVRDQFLNQEPHDHDFMVTGLDVNDLPFDKVVGSDFPVFLVKVAEETCEVALARREKKAGVGHKGFKFFTDKHMTVEDDLARRDLTVNAMAQNVLTGEVVDPFNGKGDLQNGMLRHTTEAFSEDPLRVFRVARFAAKFRFEVAEDTKHLMATLVGELRTLPCERVWGELEKTLKTDAPSRFFEVLQEVGALKTFFEEVANLNVPDKHDGTAFNHTMKVMDAGTTPMEKFGLLCHDLGKGVTPKEAHPSHFKHDKLGEEPVLFFCTRLRVPKKFQRFGLSCARNHMKLKLLVEMKPGKVVRFVLNLGNNFEDVCRVSFLDSLHREGADRQENQRLFREVRHVARRAFEAERMVTGKMLVAEGRKPGANFGDVLFQRRVEFFKEV